MAESAALLVDEVLPEQPIRQWVLSFPFQLRFVKLHRKVTNSAINALAMGLATTFVLLCSSTLISLFRKFIPKQVRIATYIVIIATFVTIVDYTIQAITWICTMRWVHSFS